MKNKLDITNIMYELFPTAHNVNEIIDIFK